MDAWMDGQTNGCIQTLLSRLCLASWSSSTLKLASVNCCCVVLNWVMLCRCLATNCSTSSCSSSKRDSRSLFSLCNSVTCNSICRSTIKVTHNNVFILICSMSVHLHCIACLKSHLLIIYNVIVMYLFIEYEFKFTSYGRQMDG